ncbi:MAG TPA: dihydropteroate synthase [Firmicutes bacterium]|nr:dihydropteroate synthase [Bacillota bacterium]
MGVEARILEIRDIERIRKEMAGIGVSPEGILIMASKAVHRVVKLTGVPIRAAILIKQEMLAKGGEAALPEAVARLSVERTDVIMAGTLRQYENVLASLKRQPFGLKEIACSIERALHNYGARRSIDLECGRHRLHLGERTYIMGILNVTPDSFSDGGLYLDTDAAVAHARALVADGADIIDVGGESTRPGAQPVPCEEELARVIPVIERIREEIPVPISIDTYKAEVARQAIRAGAGIINDISALRMDPDLGRVAAEHDVPVVLMHMQGEPRTMQADPRYKCVVSEVISFLREAEDRAVSCGIRPERIIVDPGIGFGKLLEHNLEILRRLREFTVLGHPILVGTSRKSFIASMVGRSLDERDDGTLATVALAVAGGADIVRVHDVKRAVRAARIADAILREGERNEER